MIHKKRRLGTVSKNIFTGGLILVLWYQPHLLIYSLGRHKILVPKTLGARGMI